VPGRGRRHRKADHELMAVLAMTCSEWCGSVVTLWRASSALATVAGKWWAAPWVPVAWPWWSGVACHGRGRGVWGAAAAGIGEGAGCFGVYRASGLGLPGAPSILDVRAQAGTRGAHQAARKPGRCRDALAGAGVASGGGGVWRPGRVRPRVGVGL